MAPKREWIVRQFSASKPALPKSTHNAKSDGGGGNQGS